MFILCLSVGIGLKKKNWQDTWFCLKASFTHGLWQFCEEELCCLNAALPQGCGCLRQQVWVVLSTLAGSEHRDVLAMLLLLLLLVTSLCLPPVLRVIWVAFLISSHPVSLSFHCNPSPGRSLGMGSLNLPNINLWGFPDGREEWKQFVETKIPPVGKFRVSKSTLQNQGCACYLITHEPEIQI